MDTNLFVAIRTKSIIEFHYKDHHRIVEPYCYGVGNNGNELLRGYQIGGISDSEIPNWKLFKVSDIENLKITNRNITLIRHEYNPNDSAMLQIYCRI
jgi:hypothetical protein